MFYMFVDDILYSHRNASWPSGVLLLVSTGFEVNTNTVEHSDILSNIDFAKAIWLARTRRRRLMYLCDRDRGSSL